MKIPPPRTVKQVKSFLGSVIWYGIFIPNLFTIAELLNRLTRKNVKFMWSTECEEAFIRLRAILATAPVFSRPSDKHEFTLQVDASNCGLDCVSTQEIDGIDRVVSYASRSLNPAERNYSVTERECLAALWGIRKFRFFIEGSHFTVITDHNSLVWVQKMKNPTGRLARWALESQQYNYTIRYRKGSQNVVPDLFSRIYRDDQLEAAEIA